jgi:hypothetical protein
VEVVELLLALLREDLAFRLTRATLLHLTTPTGQELRLFTLDVCEVHVAGLKQHPLSAVDKQLVTKLDLAQTTEIVLDGAHSGPPDVVVEHVIPGDVPAALHLTLGHGFPVPVAEVAVGCEHDRDIVAVRVLALDLAGMSQLALLVGSALLVPLLDGWGEEQSKQKYQYSDEDEQYDELCSHLLSSPFLDSNCNTLVRVTYCWAERHNDDDNDEHDDEQTLKHEVVSSEGLQICEGAGHSEGWPVSPLKPMSLRYAGTES